METRRRRTALSVALCLGLALGLSLAAPATADWLVTRDGTRLETQGPWEEKGRLVVFTAADGTLSSMRLDQVDLEASRLATRATAEEAAQPVETAAEAAPAEPAPARRRITTEDIGRGTISPPAGDAAAGSEEAAGAAEGEPAAAITSQLVVLSSQEEETFDGHVRISGSLSNSGQTTVLAAGLTVYLQDAEGEVGARGEAVLSRRALAPGQVATFTADFPDVFAYTAVSFRANGTRMVTNAPATPAEPDLYGEGFDDGVDDEGFEPETPDLYDPDDSDPGDN